MCIRQDQNSPLSLGLLVDNRVVVLKVAAASLSLKSGPEHVLVHSVGLDGPSREVLGVEGKVVHELVDWVWVIEEEDLWHG